MKVHLNLNKYKCPCCGYFTFRNKLSLNKHETCEICYWRNDMKAYEDVNDNDNINNISLIHAIDNYNRMGAIRHTRKKDCRKPKFFDKMSINFLPIILLVLITVLLIILIISL